MAPADATTSPEVRSQTVGRDRRRADVDRRSVHPVLQAGPHRDDVAVAVDCDGDPPVAVPQRRLERLEHLQVAAQVREAPLLAKCRLDPAQIAGGVVHVGLGDLDEPQPHHRIDANRMHLGPLAHHLPVNLAVGRDIDDDIAPELRRAAQASPRGQRRPLLVKAPLDRSEFGEMLDPGAHPVLGEFSDALHDLAAPADAPSAAHRVEVDSERPGRIQDRHPERKLPPPSRRCEDDQRIFGCIAGRLPSRGVVSHGGGADRRRAGPAPLRCLEAAALGTSRSTAGSPGRFPS